MAKHKYEVKPPWVEYPGSDPIWAGWRQGFGEQWLHEKWLPFWRKLSVEECRQYLRKHPPPTDEWDFYLNTAWRK